jgi:hypothetical protein
MVEDKKRLAPPGKCEILRSSTESSNVVFNGKLSDCTEVIALETKAVTS